MIYEKIIELIKSNTNKHHNKQIYPVFGNNEIYLWDKINKKNIGSIQERHQKTIWAVDGSNKTVLESSGKAVELVKVAAISEDNTIIINKSIIVVTPIIHDNEIIYAAHSFNIGGEELEEVSIKINAYDPTITTNIFKARPSIVASLVRRFLEWKIIDKIKDKESLILKDGSLHIGVKGELNIAIPILKNKNIIGVVKNSTIISNRGMNIIKEVENIFNNICAPWLYHYIAKGQQNIHPAIIDIIKLHEKGRAYRVEMFKDKYDKELYGELIRLSNDALYIGYPYLLAKADKITKVKDYEVKQIKLTLLNHLKEEFETDLHDFFKMEE